MILMKHIFPKITVSMIVLLFGYYLKTQASDKKPRDEYILKVDVDLRLLHITVFDQKDQLIQGLTQKNFQVYEDKIQQEIAIFKVEDIPVSLGLVIDNSGSMRTKRSRVNKAALTFVKTSNPEDEVFLINFNDQVYIDQDFTENPDDLTDALDHIYARGGTALYDAIYLSLEHLRGGRKDKRTLLVITDGEDKDSRYDFGTVLEFARESYASIYIVGLFDKKWNRTRNQKKAAKLLAELSLETGGAYFFPESVGEVEAICTQVAHQIRNQYTIGYKPTNLSRDGTWRDVTVKIDPSGKGKKNKWTARTKRGYYAPSDS